LLALIPSHQSEKCQDIYNLLSIMVIKTPIHRSVSVTTSLHPSHVCACTNQEQDFQRHVSSSFFCVQSVMVRDDCLCCWYWWNCWSSLFFTQLYGQQDTHILPFYLRHGLRKLINETCKGRAKYYIYHGSYELTYLKFMSKIHGIYVL
jgi:hypothetical protein